jgi:hypothetical protein
MIYELHISNNYEPYIELNEYELDLICKILVNLKQFEGRIDKPNAVLYAINHLPKLTNIKVYYSLDSYSNRVCKRLRQTASKRNIDSIFRYVLDLPPLLIS